jgi:hypothetical protein
MRIYLLPFAEARPPGSHPSRLNRGPAAIDWRLTGRFAHASERGRAHRDLGRVISSIDWRLQLLDRGASSVTVLIDRTRLPLRCRRSGAGTALALDWRPDNGGRASDKSRLLESEGVLCARCIVRRRQFPS